MTDIPDPALVERALTAWENVYEGQCELGSPRWTDNREAAMAAAVAAILAALRESGHLVEWRPIAEAPRDGTTINSFVPGIGVVSCYWQDDCWFQGWMNWSMRSDGWQVNPTHWAPLPVPPATAATEGE